MINITNINNSISQQLGSTNIEYQVLLNSLTPYASFYYSISIFVLSLFMHELGHYLVLRRFNKRSKVEFFINQKPFLRTGEIPSYIKNRDLRIMYFMGILFGFLPIIGAVYIHSFFLLLIAPYLVGCSSDIKEIVRRR